MFRNPVILFVFMLGGCANITATALQPDGRSEIPGAASGFRYYPPKPYLLVMELPAPAPTPPNTPGKTGLAAPKAPSSTDNSQTQAPASQSPAPVTDLSFLASSATQIAKVIYLPDYQHPMAVTMSTGLLGIASLQLTLQDGWLLTNVSANGDNSKLGDVMIAALQAVSAGATGGASKAAPTAAQTKNALAGLTGGRVLAPGLYAFDYVPGTSRVAAVCAVAYFDSTGSHPPQAGDPGACGPSVSAPDLRAPPAPPPQ